MTLVGLGGLILLSLNAGAWALSPVFLWTCVVLVLFPLVAFSFWVQEHIAVVWSLSVGVLIPVAVFAYAIFRPAGSVPACAVARAGLILNAVLLVAGSVIRKT